MAAEALRVAPQPLAPASPAAAPELLPMPPGYAPAAPLVFRPAAFAAPGPSALVLPALGVPAAAYRRLAEALAALGTPTAVVEWRGGGASPLRAARGVDWGYADLLRQEVLGGLVALQARQPGRVALVGHSLGGHIGLMARAIAAPGVAAVFTVASGTPTLRFFSPRLRLGVCTVLAAHRLAGPLLGYFPGDRIGFGGRQPRRLMDEWALLARRGRFELGGRNLLAPPGEPGRTIPVRSLVLPEDTYAPRGATEHLLSLAGVAPEAAETYDGAGPRGHFDWLKAPQPLAERLHRMLVGAD